MLADLDNGRWKFSETGDSLGYVLDELTERAVVGPGLTYGLTISSELSQDITDSMESFTLNGHTGVEGAAIVSDINGKILGMGNITADDEEDEPASEGENAEDKDETKKKHKSYVTAPVLVGSTAKILVSGAMIASGAETYYEDEGKLAIFDHIFTNWDCGEGGYGDLVARELFGYFNGTNWSFGAFAFSANTYFVNALITMGYDTFSDIYNRYFGFNSDGDPMKGYILRTDWKSVPMPHLYQLKITDTDDEETIGKKNKMTGYFAIGMANNEGIDERVSPLYMNAVTAAVASGQMHRPYINSVSEPQPVEGTEPLTDEMKQGLRDLMYEDAVYSNCTSEDYTFCIKTGSASTGYYETDENGDLIYDEYGNEIYVPVENLNITGFIEKDGEPIRVITLYVYNGADFSNTYVDENGYEQNEIYASWFVPLYKEIAALAAETEG